MLTETRATLIHDLQARIGSIESGAKNPRLLQTLSSGFETLDRLLPGGGLAGGTLVEWLGDGSGAFTLAVAVAGFVIRAGGMLAIVGERTLFPPAAAALGVPLERTVVIHPPDDRLNLWTWEQSLRCEGIAVTLGRMERAGDVVMRRLQLAAQAGGGLGFLIRPSASQGEASWAESRLLVKGESLSEKGSDPLSKRTQYPPPNPEPLQKPGGLTPFRTGSPPSPAWHLRVELLRCRGGFGGKVAQVELHHEADDVPVVAELGDSARAE